MTPGSPSRPARVLAALLLSPLVAVAQPRDPQAKGIALPETSLQLLLRNRDALGLDGGQVVTLELKLSELQLRVRELVVQHERDLEQAKAGPQSGAPGPGEGPPRGGAGPPRGGEASPATARSRRLVAEVEALDGASVRGVRRIFRPEQLAQVDALLERRAERLARQREGAEAPAGTPAPASRGEGRSPPRSPPP